MPHARLTILFVSLLLCLAGIAQAEPSTYLAISSFALASPAETADFGTVPETNESSIRFECVPSPFFTDALSPPAEEGLASMTSTLALTTLMGPEIMDAVNSGLLKLNTTHRKKLPELIQKVKAMPAEERKLYIPLLMLLQSVPSNPGEIAVPLQDVGNPALLSPGNLGASLEASVSPEDILEEPVSKNILAFADRLPDIKETSVSSTAAGSAPAGINWITGNNATLFAAWVQLLQSLGTGSTISNVGNWNSNTLTLLANPGIDVDGGIDSGIASVNPGNYNIEVFFDNGTQSFTFASPDANPNGPGPNEPLTIAAVAPTSGAVQLNSP